MAAAIGGESGEPAVASERAGGRRNACDLVLPGCRDRMRFSAPLDRAHGPRPPSDTSTRSQRSQVGMCFLPAETSGVEASVEGGEKENDW